MHYGTEYRFTKRYADRPAETGAVMVYSLLGIDGDYVTFEGDVKYDDDGIVRMGPVVFGPEDTVTLFA